MRITPMVLVACFVSPWATAEIYRWVDAQGNVHFDSRSRPGAEQVEVRPQVIERDEATRVREARTERFFDARRQEQQAAKQAAGEWRVKRERACSEWKQQLSQLSEGGRYFREDAKGERVYYSDEEIGATRRQLASRIGQNCS
ncbi:DUF4124 domain-containing protein [Stutzerimonas zhaodongensis]|uniref:DUF4124 domain-containing protein n=1 Tax=Stutzerimonas zhaodongensis TaxID=1176257 RepID=UPI0021062366|nr:DUF4124 domain-containing protein [Stutzerimonas zhaodongensis]MCQ2029147.1 DUF4124 domain-containing protein [Stutzerimonas zhaodongensis]